MGHYGIGHLTAVTILAELGDARRFSSSRDAVRYAGLDITVKQSDQRRAPGHLSRQGPPACAALYEAAQSARRHSSPHRDYYQQAAERLGGNRACLAVARKLLKRSYHTLRDSATRHCNPREIGLRAQPSLTPMHRGRLPASSCRRVRVRPPTTERPQSSSQRITPSTISRRRRTARRGPRYAGVRAHRTHTVKRAHAPRRHRREPKTKKIQR